MSCINGGNLKKTKIFDLTLEELPWNDPVAL